MLFSFFVVGKDYIKNKLVYVGAAKVVKYSCTINSMFMLPLMFTAEYTENGDRTRTVSLNISPNRGDTE